MADSDDDYDRKRRDKFRGERSAGDNYRSDRRDDRSRGGGGRDDWPERGRGRPDYRDYRASVRDRGYSPNREAPPVKRMRPDWDDGRPRYGGHEAYGGGGVGGYPAWSHEHYPMHGGAGHGFHPPPQGGGALHGNREPPVNSDIQTQPQMMTLKQFLAIQDDSISDSDAIQKYNEYKLEFKRQQLNEFFVAHKDEEWFKIKYHPEESLKRREEQLNYLKKRMEVFAELLEQGQVTSVNVDTTQTEQLLKLLDTVVIKLEGGSEEDLLVLDEKYQEAKLNELKNGEKTIITKGENKTTNDPDVEITEVQVIDDDIEKSNEEIEKKVDDDDESSAKVITKDEETKDRKNPKHSKSGSSSSSSSSSESEDEKEPPKISSPKEIEDTKEEDEILPTEDDSKDESKEENSKDDDHEMKSDDDDEENDKKIVPEKKKIDDDEEIDDSIEKINNENDDDGGGEIDGDGGDGEIDKDKDISDLSKTKKKDDDETEEDKTETIDLDKEKDVDNSPRALHRTSSIFLRNLAPTITKAEVEAMCKKYSGFLRVAIADPLGERRWFRRGWVTFRRDVNIKEICWNLNNIRLRDCELGAIVNRDLSRRVRPVNGITSHKTIIRSDIKLCAKIAHNLDEKSGLWKGVGKFLTAISEKFEKSTETFGLNSKNPVLQNITDYLIEEASAEEDELLGISGGENKDMMDGEIIEKDPQLILVLDKLILYLRIVHSVDFYNHCEYPYEDEMPNRCGIIHARGPPPQKVTNNEIQDYTRNFENKMASFLAKNATLESGELKNMGSKDCEAEVEKFVQANTQELSKDKWLCPLSGKKFKGPDFIRKHIFNKHGEKVDEVRKEVEYFNNYLKDPKRPQLPEHPGNNKKPNEMPPQSGYRPGYPPPTYVPPYAPYVPPIAPPRPRPGYARRGPGADYRPIIHYRDLDAVDNSDFFS